MGHTHLFIQHLTLQNGGCTVCAIGQLVVQTADTDQVGYAGSKDLVPVGQRAGRGEGGRGGRESCLSSAEHLLQEPMSNSRPVCSHTHTHTHTHIHTHTHTHTHTDIVICHSNLQSSKLEAADLRVSQAVQAYRPKWKACQPSTKDPRYPLEGKERQKSH